MFFSFSIVYVFPIQASNITTTITTVAAAIEKKDNSTAVAGKNEEEVKAKPQGTVISGRLR